ncbi:hypothetical protein EMIHUDRAFT_231922 [Emiliania huxleyi CCMP1516]|uniref:Uncharacterized protein n=2 Tax=Emiliania huxleyi TaxID=2903 RepID=A0A0D3K6X3_EMIH1|nr:hypothetical protein EMIHUDRAFT_231922 [Emiliania huxleyi CCMP1516]EOD31508.1 hypothetical protein EMIHUDRAFT_231922 [Emiliania huxleyi CCMP1516]|eukprot:XP_005783937.1 hypothetical protein EMIHUDRAFT_231922 [Emiliania huxleyi CCMP1516]
MPGRTKAGSAGTASRRLLAEVEAEKRGKGKKGKKKKKGGGSAAGPSQEPEAAVEGAEAPSEGAEVLSEAAAAEAAKKAEEARLIRLLESCHEERIRLGITAESQAAALAEMGRKSGDPSSLGDVRNLKLGIGEKCQCEGRAYAGVFAFEASRAKKARQKANKAEKKAAAAAASEAERADYPHAQLRENVEFVMNGLEAATQAARNPTGSNIRVAYVCSLSLLASSHDAEDEVVGTYALPWEERPEYDEVMATYGHGM